MRDHARYTYEEILRLEPDNKHAQQELREVRRQLGREAPHPPAPDHWQAPGPHQGQVHESSATDVENPARLGPYSAWPFLLLVVLNGAGISIDSWFLLLTAVLMIGVVVGGWLFWRQGKERPIALGLHEAEPPPAPKSTRFRGFTYLAILFGAIGVLLLVVWWGS